MTDQRHEQRFETTSTDITVNLRWSEFFDAVNDGWGWIGERPESLEEYIAWRVADKVADDLLGRASWTDVTDEVKRNVNERIAERVESVVKNALADRQYGGKPTPPSHRQDEQGNWDYVTIETYYEERFNAALRQHIQWKAETAAREAADA